MLGVRVDRVPSSREGVIVETRKTVAELCREHGIDDRQLAERSGLDGRRVRAIVEGRWTPSPAERDRIAGAFGLSKEQIVWGHQTPVQHLYGHGPQFGRTP
jgi:transcriptional regulator with XRE-family HTH domain